VGALRAARCPALERDDMEITASMVKDLRELTGAGMMDCKKALAETDGDLDKAVDVLRTKGLADLAKKSGRATNEGLVATRVSDDGHYAALVEVNCETDFVARNADFAAFVDRIAAHVVFEKADDIAALKAQPWSPDSGLTVEQALGEMVTKLGENMGIARVALETVDGPGLIATYVHGVGRIGVLVKVSGAEASNHAAATFARDIAMHVAAANPGWTRRDEVPADVLEHELSIYKAQAAESGKPEAIQEKIALGRVEKFYKEVCLTEQPFVKDPDITVDKLAKEVSAKAGAELRVVGFVRWTLGETGDGQPAPSC
jgi:elongation factor Ts